MRWLALSVCVGALGCSKETTTMEPENITIDDYHGFAADATWTYRDDGVLDEAPEDSALLRARYTGDGVLDLRRGSRWADATRVAEVVGHSGAINDLVFSPDDKQLVTVGEDGAILVWNLYLE